MTSSRLLPRQRQFLFVSWALVVLSLALLAVRYPELPQTIPTVRTLLGAPLRSADKDLGSVFRIPLMGVGQLGAATAMAHAAGRAGQRGWAALWVAACGAATAKTCIESVQFAYLLLGGTAVERASFIAALLPVLCFLLVAARLWHARRLEPAAPLAPSSIVAVATSLAVWLLFAAAPLW